MRFDFFFHDGQGQAGCYIGGLWVQTGKEMLQATGCRAGRNRATRSEEALGPVGTGRDKELTDRIQAAIQPHLPSPERSPEAWVSAMAKLGFGFRSLDSQPPDGIGAEVHTGQRWEVVTGGAGVGSPPRVTGFREW